MERRRRRRGRCGFIFLNCDFLLECVFLVCVVFYIELFVWRENGGCVLSIYSIVCLSF